MSLGGLVGQRRMRRRMEADHFAILAIRIWQFGDCSGVRRTVIRSFFANPLKLADVSLLNILAKSMLGVKLLGAIRRFRYSRRQTAAT